MHEFFKVHQVGISSESRKTLIGRITKPGRAQRADLPILHAGVCQEVHELKGESAQGADTGGPGKRSRMKKNASAARGQPVKETFRHAATDLGQNRSEEPQISKIPAVKTKDGSEPTLPSESTVTVID